MTAPVASAIKAGYALSPRPAKQPAPVRHVGKCGSKCKGGNDCDCSGRYRHSWHVCHDKDCLCHEKYRGTVSK